MSVSTMKKLTVLAYSADAEAIVRKLMNLKCVQLQTVPMGEGLLPLDTLENDRRKAEADRRLADIRRALPVLCKYTERKTGLGRVVHKVDRAAFCSEGRDVRAWETVCKTLEAISKKESLTAEQTQNAAKMASLEPWLVYDAPLNDTSSAYTEMRLGVYPADTDVMIVRSDLEAAGAYVEEVDADEHGLYVAVTFMRSGAEEIERLLAEQGFLKTDFPEIATTARGAYEAAEKYGEQLDEALLKTEVKLQELAEGLADVEILCDIEATTVNVCLQKRKLAATKNCVVLSGWYPIFAEERITRTLAAFECACELAEPDEGEEPPVLLRNNKFASTFEWVIGMYSYPKYGAFDPTLVMSIFYFIIFGLMFADVGYGLLLVAACFGGIKLLNPKTGLRRMMLMFGYCGFSCILMGVIFGGWFGDLPTAIMSNLLKMPIDTGAGHFFASGLWFNPLDDPMTFLILSLGVGAVHMIAGMVIDFAVKCKRGQKWEAICTIVPYWILFAGLGLFLVSSTAGAIGALVGALSILLFNGYGQRNIFKRLIKGLSGLYGLISYASDLLSYSRILALGLVAGVIAKVINLITMLGAGGPVGFFFMLIVLIVGHLLNIAINILGTFIHASRLQYLEFFGKFFEDGGEPFEPAAPVEDYTEEPDPTL